MGEIEWAMWANEQALLSAICMFMGGIIGVASFFNNWQFAAATIVTSVLVFLLEYPRSKRKKGNTIERQFQHILVPGMDKCGFLTKNYFVRFVIHILFSVPTCFLLPTILGGMCLMISAIIYLVAAIKGEEWKPLYHKKEDTSKRVNLPPSLDAPSYPPPRVEAVRRELPDGNINGGMSHSPDNRNNRI